MIGLVIRIVGAVIMGISVGISSTAGNLLIEDPLLTIVLVFGGAVYIAGLKADRTGSE